MKIFKSLAISFLLLASFTLVTAPILAQGTTPPPSSGGSATSITGGVEKFGNAAFGQSTPLSLVQIIAVIINALLGLLGLIFLVLIIYAGFTWMTAMSAEDKVKKAKAIITQASIGLVIVLLSYVISSYVFNIIQEGGLSGGGGTTTTGSN